MEDPAANATKDQIAHAASVSGVSGSPAAPKKTGFIKITKMFASATPASAPKPSVDVLGALVQEIESLKKPDALAKLDKLEAAQERSQFEIGGVLSAVLKNKWFDPYPSFDKWVESTRNMRRAKARALIRNYDAVAGAGLAPAQFEKIGWTKMRALAPVLTPDNAAHWSDVAAERTRAELEELVKQELASSKGAAPAGATATETTISKPHHKQVQLAAGAFGKVEKATGATLDAEELAHAGLDDDGHSLQKRLAEAGPEAAIVAVVDFVSSLDNATAIAALTALISRAEEALALKSK